MSVKKYLTTRYVDDNGCFLCENIPNQDGYIRVKPFGSTTLKMLHVVEWEAVNGVKPKGKELNHKCKNRGCCNLEHLELLDESEHASLGNRDRVGINLEKLGDELIAEIYCKVKYEGYSINKMSESYNIKRSTLSSIMNKRSRNRVTDKIDSEIH